MKKYLIFVLLLCAGYITADESGLRIVRGVLDSSAKILSGSGFTAKRTATGKFEITLDTPFVDVPAVTASVNAGGGYMVAVPDVKEGSFNVFTKNADNDYDSHSFSFIAVGK